MTSAARPKSQQASRGNDLKKLKTQYGTQLSTLRELFSDWSDEDLLFALQEADGDLELAAVRISEGWANQWGEVKGKKAKKETVQKQKPVVPVTENQRLSKTERGIPSSRGGFGGRGRGSARGGRPANFGDRRSKSGKPNHNSQMISGQDQTVIDGDLTWANSATTTPIDSTKDHSSWVSSTPAPAPAATLATAPTSWASLLKTQPAPEPVKEEESPVVNGLAEKDQSPELEDSQPIVEESSATVEELASPEEPSIPQANVADTSNEKELSKQAEPIEPVSEKTTSAKPRTPIGRRLKQDVPVVLPGGSASLGSVGVRFGNLNLADHESALEEEAPLKDDDTTLIEKETETEVDGAHTAHSQITDFNNARQSSSVPSNQVYGDNRLPQTPSGLVDHNSNFGPGLVNSSYIKSEQQTYGQQQPPQQNFGQTTGEQHNTPYSYLPSQVPNGLSGYSMNPMTSVPDYALYSNEAQRAAMGYYDPSMLHHSPSNTSASTYQTREKYNHDTNNSTAQQNSSAAGNNPTVQAQHQQHAYANVPYYPYYYMPNQFQGYQQPGYGQPFVNKNMYPMYQHGSKPTASSPYAAAGSPYQHHYSPVASYDDLSVSHQHGMVHDYQKHYGTAPQYQTYMGQPSAQAGQGQGQQNGKNDLNQYGKASNVQAGGAGSNASQSQHVQQQQQQSSMYAGQQQAMYSPYQYSQQQQPHRQPQTQPQGTQPQGNGQGQGPQSAGNQPYWTQ